MTTDIELTIEEQRFQTSTQDDKLNRIWKSLLAMSKQQKATAGKVDKLESKIAQMLPKDNFKDRQMDMQKDDNEKWNNHIKEYHTEKWADHDALHTKEWRDHERVHTTIEVAKGKIFLIGFLASTIPAGIALAIFTSILNTALAKIGAGVVIPTIK